MCLVITANRESHSCVPRDTESLGILYALNFLLGFKDGAHLCNLRRARGKSPHTAQRFVLWLVYPVYPKEILLYKRDPRPNMRLQ